MIEKEEEKINLDELSEREVGIGLSKIYSAQAKYHGDRARVYSDIFSQKMSTGIIIITYLLVLLFVFTTVSAEILWNYTIKIETHLLMSSLLLSTIGALIWLGTFYKNREREERILEAEYSHKETLVIFFEEYSSRKEISSDKEAKHILLELHKHVIDSAAYNPSIRLGKENNDHPTIKVLNELSNNFTKVVDRVYDIPRKAKGKSTSDQSNKTTAG